MNRAPAFQFYPDDWLSSPKISTMSPAEEGAYIRLLSYSWNDPDCTIPDDDTSLAMLSRLGEAWLSGSGIKLRACFVPHPKKTGRLFNIRLMNERKKQVAWRKKSQEGGKRSAESRASRSQEQARVVEGCFKGGSISAEPNGNSSSSSSFSPSLKKEKEKKEKAVSASPSPASSATRQRRITDEEFLQALRQNVAYRGIDIDAELGKIDAWLLTPNGSGKKKTRKRIFDWMNRAAERQRELSPVAAPLPTVCAEKVLASSGRGYDTCGKPIASEQASPVRPFCLEHLQGRQRIDAHRSNGHAS